MMGYVDALFGMIPSAAKPVPGIPRMRLGSSSVTASVRKPGNHTANHFPSCTAKQAKQFETFTRQRKRQVEFLDAMAQINRKAGGDPRRTRRAMARSLRKNMRGVMNELAA